MADGQAHGHVDQEAKDTITARIRERIADCWRAQVSPGEGQSLVEYAMIILFITIACMVALMTMADAINNLWQIITDVLLPTLSGG